LPGAQAPYKQHGGASAWCNGVAKALAMTALRILILSDGRPGHYHLAEGVAAAIARRRPVVIARAEVKRQPLTSARVLKGLLYAGRAGSTTLLRLGYRLDARALPPCDLVVSGGGDTIAANAAIARLRNVPNIFCGTLRHLAPERFSLVVSSYARHKDLPRHLVCLKPSAFDPDALAGGTRRAGRNAQGHPTRALLLVGGDSGLFHYEQQEWRRLLDALPELTAAWGTRWLVSTSRRTDPIVGDALADLARPGDVIERFVDYRTAGPGTLPDLFAEADMAVVTEDSSTMLSEAVAARLPVIGVSPAARAFKPEEAEYREFMHRQGWCRSTTLDALTPGHLSALLAQITPLAENHLDRLARELEARLAHLITPAPAAARR
jgi:hypothetical protein